MIQMDEGLGLGTNILSLYSNFVNFIIIPFESLNCSYSYTSHISTGTLTNGSYSGIMGNLTREVGLFSSSLINSVIIFNLDEI